MKKAAKSFVEEDKASLASASGKDFDEESEPPPLSVFNDASGLQPGDPKRLGN